jgi:hypothetical protein
MRNAEGKGGQAGVGDRECQRRGDRGRHGCASHVVILREPVATEGSVQPQCSVEVTGLTQVTHSAGASALRPECSVEAIGLMQVTQ